MPGPACSVRVAVRVPGAGQTQLRAGYRVGRQLTEKYMYNRPQLKDSLDIIRFICKEFWGDVFRKQVPPAARAWLPLAEHA